MQKSKSSKPSIILFYLFLIGLPKEQFSLVLLPKKVIFLLFQFQEEYAEESMEATLVANCCKQAVS